MARKATNAEMNKRVNEVAKMLADGATRPEILQYASAKWSISERQTDTLIKRANEIFTEESDVIREAEFGKALRRLNTLYAKALKVQDYRVCLSVQREIHNLLALPIPETKIHEHRDWQDRAVDDIRNGVIPPQAFDELASRFDHDLATQLFIRAGIPVPVREDTR